MALHTIRLLNTPDSFDEIAVADWARLNSPGFLGLFITEEDSEESESAEILYEFYFSNKKSAVFFALRWSGE